MSRQYLWLQKIGWPLLRKRLGNKCTVCATTENLEFAHTHPTSVSGRGRGSFQRYMDINRNIDKYVLLCRLCHRLEDRAAALGLPSHTNQFV